MYKYRIYLLIALSNISNDVVPLQMYDFSAPDETPCVINYHPHQQVFACGFMSGTVRVFNVENTCLLAEHRYDMRCGDTQSYTLILIYTQYKVHS